MDQEVNLSGPTSKGMESSGIYRVGKLEGKGKGKEGKENWEREGPKEGREREGRDGFSAPPLCWSLDAPLLPNLNPDPIWNVYVLGPMGPISQELVNAAA